MILIIDTTERFEIKLGFSSGREIDFVERQTNNQSKDLLPAIQEELQKRDADLKDLQGILAHRGPGSYTGTRVGVTTANALAWSLNIPVLGYINNELEPALINIIEKNEFSGSILPVYLN